MVVKEIDFFGDYKLRYNWLAFEKMAQALGAPAFSQFDKIMANLGPTEIRLIIWAGLLHQNPGLQKEQVADIIDEYMETHDMQDLTEVMMAGLTESSMFKTKAGDMGEVPAKRSMNS